MKKRIQSAKDLLKSNGYFVDSLFCIEDVQNKFENCSDKKAMEVLLNVFDSEQLGGELNEAIQCEGESLGLILIEEED